MAKSSCRSRSDSASGPPCRHRQAGSGLDRWTSRGRRARERPRAGVGFQRRRDRPQRLGENDSRPPFGKCTMAWLATTARPALEDVPLIRGTGGRRAPSVPSARAHPSPCGRARRHLRPHRHSFQAISSHGPFAGQPCGAARAPRQQPNGAQKKSPESRAGCGARSIPSIGRRLAHGAQWNGYPAAIARDHRLSRAAQGRDRPRRVCPSPRWYVFGCPIYSPARPVRQWARNTSR